MIYFLQNATTLNIKIGFTDGDPLERMAALQVGSCGKLVFLASCPGTEQDETRLHKRLDKFWVRGEWFKPEPPVLSAMISIGAAKAPARASAKALQ